jgi:hypothetical protein
MTHSHPTPTLRPGRAAARTLFAALLCLGWMTPHAAADEKDDTIRKLEEQLRRATDRIDDLLKTQKLEREESAKQREVAEKLRQALDQGKKDAADQLAAARADAAKAARAIDAVRKEGAETFAAAKAEAVKLREQLGEEQKQRVFLRDLLEIVQTEKEKLALELAQYKEASQIAIVEREKQLLKERKRAEDLAEDRAATAKALEAERQKTAQALEAEREQAAVAARKAREAQEVIAALTKDAARLKTELVVERDRAVTAAVNQQLLQERAARLETRVVELEKALELARPRADRIEGKVTAVNEGLLKLNIGSDAGLKKGQELDVIRLEPKPLYLGKVKVVSVEPKEAVAQLIGAPKETIKVGDQVMNRP